MYYLHIQDDIHSPTVIRIPTSPPISTPVSKSSVGLTRKRFIPKHAEYQSSISLVSPERHT